MESADYKKYFERVILVHGHLGDVPQKTYKRWPGDFLKITYALDEITNDLLDIIRSSRETRNRT